MHNILICLQLNMNVRKLINDIDSISSELKKEKNMHGSIYEHKSCSSEEIFKRVEFNIKIILPQNEILL